METWSDGYVRREQQPVRGMALLPTELDTFELGPQASWDRWLRGRRVLRRPRRRRAVRFWVSLTHKTDFRRPNNAVWSASLLRYHRPRVAGRGHELSLRAAIGIRRGGPGIGQRCRQSACLTLGDNGRHPRWRSETLRAMFRPAASSGPAGVAQRAHAFLRPLPLKPATSAPGAPLPRRHGAAARRYRSAGASPRDFVIVGS